VDGLWGLEPDADDRLQVVAREDGARLGDQRLTALLPTPDGALWVGTWAGVARLEPATMKVSRVAREAPGQVGVPAGYASALVRDAAGRLWVGIMGAGIRLLEWPAGGGAPVARRVTTKEGLPHDGVNALVLDRRGGVWASTDDGIARIAPDTLAVQTYGAAQGVGIRTYWTGSGALAPNGQVLFGGSGGLTIVDPVEPAASAEPIGLVVTEVRVGDAPPLHSFPLGPETPALVVDPGRRSLFVEFAALDFVAPQTRRYQFRMSGVDTAWVDVDAARRIASYTNLPPGGHALELRTAAAGGAWSPPVRLSVTVVPRWHEMPWVGGRSCWRSPACSPAWCGRGSRCCAGATVCSRISSRSARSSCSKARSSSSNWPTLTASPGSRTGACSTTNCGAISPTWLAATCHSPCC
jgi:hypothetical protein